MQLTYSLREGIAGFRRAKFAVATSTSAMVVALVMLGMFVMMGIQAHYVSDWLRQRVGEVEIFLEPAEKLITDAIVTRASVTPGVAEALYISSEEAQKVFRDEFGEGAEIYFDEPFLPASIRVRVEPAYANPDSLTRLVEEFSSWNRVDEVVFNQSLLVKVQRNLRLLTLLGITIGLLVTLAALFLVANTIRLTIYARRLLIRTMKLVGATDLYIRRPFLVEGILQGLLAGLTAGLLIWILYGLFAGYIPQLGKPTVFMGFLLTLLLVLVGGVLGWGASQMAVRRFIKTVALH